MDSSARRISSSAVAGGNVLLPVQEDNSSHSKHSQSSSTISSIKNKFRFFKRTKKRNVEYNGGSSLGNNGDGDEAARHNSSLSSEGEEDDVVRVDKFGFVVEQDTAASAAAHNSSGGPISLMKRFARNGLPDSNMRHRAWTMITGVDNILLNREGEYDALVSKSRVDMKQIQECLMGGHHRTEWGVIERDLRRTFPKHQIFRDISERDADTISGDGFAFQRSNQQPSQADEVSTEEIMAVLGKISGKTNVDEGRGKKALRRILRAYSVYDSEVGYCQGMNFLAGMLLTLLPEEESFWMLVVIMNEEPYKLRDLFSKDMTGTHEVLYIADKLVNQFLPELYDHLENEQVHISMFVTPWLMTIYTSTFPFALVTRVWDSFLCDGWSVVYQTMLALLGHVQEELLARNFEQILTYLRGFQSTVDSEIITAASSKIPLKQHHIQEHTVEFRRLKESGEIQVEEIPQNRFKIPESVDGCSVASSGGTAHNLAKVHRFIAKLKRSVREISVEDLSAKLIPIVGKPKLALVLSNVLSQEECTGLIKRAKGEQFEDVLMRKSGRNELADVASCRRSLLEDIDLAAELFDRIAGALQGTELEDKLHHAPWISEGDSGPLNATGLNDRLHILRYGTGQFFSPHRDSRYKRGSETSHITIQVFLNNNFSGGKTSFRGGNRFLDVKPKAGSVLLFDQDLRREECEVLAGRKFILRSDVMFAPA